MSRNLLAYLRLYKDGFINSDFNASITFGGENYYRNDKAISNATRAPFVKPLFLH